MVSQAPRPNPPIPAIPKVPPVPVVTPPAPSPPDLAITWAKLPDNYILPDDPVENIQQPPLAAALTDALGENGRIQPAMLIASNFALVAQVRQQTITKAPDWLYVPKVYPSSPNAVRRSYTPHLEGEPVAVVMEFLSQTDCGELSARSSYPYGKLYFYEQILKVPFYVTFDPAESSFELRQLSPNNGYQLQAADENGRYWIEPLQLFLGLWKGERLGQDITWLRWWDSQGNLLLWSSEKARQETQRAEQEAQRAEQEKHRADAAESEIARLKALLAQQEQPGN